MATHARETKFGFNLATAASWGTSAASATAVGSGDGHYVRDDLGLVLTMQQSMDDSAGQSFIGSVQTGNAESVAITVPLYMHYLDTFMNIWYAVAFGTGGTSPVQMGATTAYSNTFEPATSKTGLYGTFVQDKVADIFEVPGAKCSGFTLSVGEMGRMEMSLNFIGDIVVEDSSTNTSTEVGNLTFPTQGLRSFFREAVIRINAQGGGALGSSDAIDVTDMTLTFNQPLDIRHVAGQTTIIEPEENGFPEVTMELTAGRSGATWNAFFAGHRNTTAYKMDITFTGATLATTNYAVLYQFPNVILTPYTAPVAGGAGQIIPTVGARALSTTAAPTGMTGVTVPVRVTTTGEQTANPFAV
jgi:hypothetical protein